MVFSERFPFPPESVTKCNDPSSPAAGTDPPILSAAENTRHDNVVIDGSGTYTTLCDDPGKAHGSGRKMLFPADPEAAPDFILVKRQNSVKARAGQWKETGPARATGPRFSTRGRRGGAAT